MKDLTYMVSRLEVLCDMIMESAWLMALILIPLFFNPYSFQGFDFNKALLMRSLALVAGIAWILKKAAPRFRSAHAATRNAPEIPFWKRPLVLPLLMLGGIVLLSTTLSVAPRISWWGLYGQMQGTSSQLCYILLFWVCLDGLRTSAQWRRFQFAVILTSFAVSAYGLSQHFGRDPLTGWQVFSGRITANMGNPIFLAGYLIMAVPITLERLIEEIRNTLSNRQRALRLVCACALALSLLAQVAAVVLTGSRGPAIGIAAGGYVAIFLYLVSQRREGRLRLRETGLAFGTSILGLALFGFGFWHYRLLPRSPGLSILLLSVTAIGALYLLLLVKNGARWLWLSWLLQAALPVLLIILLRALPVGGSSIISRAAGMVSSERLWSGTIEVRRLLWKGVDDLVRKNEPLTGPGNVKDPLTVMRPWIGYGPDTMSLVSLRYYNSDFTAIERQNTTWDRAHNESLDSIVSMGLFGFAANLFLYFSLCYHALRRLNFIRNTGDRRMYVVLSAAALLLCVGIPCIFGAYYMVGVGAIVAVLAAILFYGAYVGFQKGNEPVVPPAGHSTVLLALLAAILAHLVEIHIGIATTPSQSCFYLFLAALVAWGDRDSVLEVNDAADGSDSRAELAPKGRSKQAASKISRAPKTVASWIRLLPCAILTATVLAVTDWTLIARHGASDTWGIFWGSWVKYPAEKGQEATGPAGIWIVLLTIALGLVLALGEEWKTQTPKRLRDSGAIPFLLISVGAWLLFGLILAARLQAGSVSLSPEAALDLVSGLLSCFAAGLGVLLIAQAVSLHVSKPHEREFQATPIAAWVLGILLLTGWAFLTVSGTLDPIRADMSYKLGIDTENSGALRPAIVLYRQAVNAAPDQDYYRFFLGRALVREASNTSDTQVRRQLFDQAEPVLLQALKISPFNTMNIRNLAFYYVSRAEQEQNSAVRTNLLQRAVSCYQDAGRLSPSNSDLYKEWGRAHFLLGQLELAQQLYKRSLTLNADNDSTYALLGELEGSRGSLEEALGALNQACRINPKNISTQISRILLLRQLGRYDEQVAADLDRQAAGMDDPPTLHQMSSLFAQVGDYRRALSYAQRVYALLSPEQQSAYYPTLQQLQGRLGQ